KRWHRSASCNWIVEPFSWEASLLDSLQTPLERKEDAMGLFLSVIDPGRRWLAKHINRLRRTLENLYDRLPASIAIAVARAAEDAVREGVQALLADTPPLSPPDYTPSHYPRSNFAPAGWRDTQDEDDELRQWEEGINYEPEPRGRSETNAQA